MNLQNELERAKETEWYSEQRLCYYQQRLSYWRQRRKKLERLIEQDSPFDEFLGDLWDNLDNDKILDE